MGPQVQQTNQIWWAPPHATWATIWTIQKLCFLPLLYKFIYLSIHVSINLSIYLSIYMCIYPGIHFRHSQTITLFREKEKTWQEVGTLPTWHVETFCTLFICVSSHWRNFVFHVANYRVTLISLYSPWTPPQSEGSSPSHTKWSCAFQQHYPNSKNKS